MARGCAPALGTDLAVAVTGVRRTRTAEPRRNRSGSSTSRSPAAARRMSGASCGPATARRTSAHQRGGRSPDAAPSAAATAVRRTGVIVAGRPRYRRRAGSGTRPRAASSRASGSTSSGPPAPGRRAAALLAAWAGADVDGCDPGGASQYTPALDAAGVPRRAGARRAHVRGGTPRPTRLAVTKALTAIDPDHPELRAARSRHPARAVAAGRRRRRGRPPARRRRGDARQEHHVGLARARARRRRARTRRRSWARCCPATSPGSASRRPRAAARGAVRGGGRRVRRQLRCRTGPRSSS